MSTSSQQDAGRRQAGDLMEAQAVVEGSGTGVGRAHAEVHARDFRRAERLEVGVHQGTARALALGLRRERDVQVRRVVGEVVRMQMAYRASRSAGRYGRIAFMTCVAGGAGGRTGPTGLRHVASSASSAAEA